MATINGKKNRFAGRADVFDELLRALTAANVSAYDLLAWAEARDLGEAIDDARDSFDDPELTTGDDLQSAWEADRDDAHDFVDAHYDLVSEAHALLCKLHPTTFQPPR